MALALERVRGADWRGADVAAVLREAAGRAARSRRNPTAWILAKLDSAERAAQLLDARAARRPRRVAGRSKSRCRGPK